MTKENFSNEGWPKGVIVNEELTPEAFLESLKSVGRQDEALNDYISEGLDSLFTLLTTPNTLAREMKGVTGFFNWLYKEAGDFNLTDISVIKNNPFDDDILVQVNFSLNKEDFTKISTFPFPRWDREIFKDFIFGPIYETVEGAFLTEPDDVEEEL